MAIKIDLTLGGLSAAVRQMTAGAQVIQNTVHTGGGSARLAMGRGFAGGDFQQLQEIREQRAAARWLNAPRLQADLAVKEFNLVRRIQKKQHEMQFGGLEDLLKGFTKFNRMLFFAKSTFETVAGLFDGMTGEMQQYAAATRRSMGSGYGGAAVAAGAVFGMDAGQMAGNAASFREALMTPIGAMGFGRPVLPAELGGPQNDFKLMWQGIQVIAAATSETAKLMKARQMRMEWAIPLANLSEGTRDQLYEVGSRRERSTRRSEMFENEIATQFSMGNQEYAEGGRGLWRQTAGPRNTIGWMYEVSARIFEGFWNGDMRPPPGGIDPLGRRVTPEGGLDPNKLAKENTDAMKELAAALRNPGLHGGGERAQSAIPAGLSGFRLQRALESDAVQLGGLSR